VAHEADLIGAPVRHDLLGAFGNPMVLLFGTIGLLLNASGTGLVLSAPAVLSMRADLDTQSIGHLVAGCGILGIIGVLFAGWNSDRHGDRLRDAFVCTIICMSGLILIGVAPTPILVMADYLSRPIAKFASALLLRP
jgi:ACS family tartrate transporter-like MFS transporter